MAGESTNNPMESGGNPGRPPLNDQGMGQPNPAPPPPASVLPDPSNITQAFDQFVDKNNELMNTVERLNKSLDQAMEKEKEIRTKMAETWIREQRLLLKGENERKKIDEEYKRYRKADGTWYEKTKRIKDEYDKKLAEALEPVNSELETAQKEILQHASALDESKKVLESEANQREQTIAEMKAMSEKVSDYNFGVGMDLEAALDNSMFALEHIGITVSEMQKRITEETTKLAEEGISKMNEEANAVAEALKNANLTKALQDEKAAFEEKMKQNEKEAEETEENRRKAAEYAAENLAQKSEEAEGRTLSDKFLNQGGVVGLSAIKDQIDAITEAEMKRYSIENPDAAPEAIRAHKEQFLESQKSLMIQKMMLDQETELNEIRKKQVETIMKEKGVSLSAATTIAKGKGDSQEVSNTQKRHKETITSLMRLEKAELVAISNMKQESVKAAEREAEAANDTPAWAQNMIDAYITQSEGLKDIFGNIFKKEDGWFKTIILILAVVIGGTIGYIYTYIQKVFGVLTAITKFIPGVGRLFSGIGSGVGGFMGKLGSGFLSLEKGLMVMSKAIPFVGNFLGFFPRLLGVFRFGFSLVSKIFYPLQILISTIDAVVGAFKGFKQMGLKGAIMGAVAQIISGLTFGLLDFQKIFNFLNNTMGGLFETFANFAKISYNMMIKPFIDAFKNIVGIFQGSGNLFSKILKSIYEVFFAIVKFLVGRLIQTFIMIPILILKAAFHVVKFFVYDLPKMLGEAMAWLWNWITSGVWLDDLLSFGEWLNNKLHSFFTDLLNTITDTLGELPLIGGAIKSALGGGTPESPAELRRAKDILDSPNQSFEAMMGQSLLASAAPMSPRNFATIPVGGGGGGGNFATIPVGGGGRGVQFAAMSMSQAYPAGTINTAAAQTSKAQYQANRQEASLISAPTTNIIGGAGGGGGGSAVLMSRTSRNNDPTLRALLFQEAPAL